MASTKRLNGLPNNIGESYFSTLKYYYKAYMADWRNSVALKTKEYDLSIDILNDTITPEKCQIKALITWNSEFRTLIKRVVEQEGFPANFITKAQMDFQIRSNKGQPNTISCNVILEDINGRKYQNRKPIRDAAYKSSFEPFSIIDKLRYFWARKILK